MNEQPKSTWTKPWKGPRALFLWFLLLTCGAFVVVFCIGWLSFGNLSRMDDVVTLSFLSALAPLLALISMAASRFVHWLCCWRNLRRFLFGAACVATLIALFYAEENLRGKWAWESFKREWEAKGEHFDLASLAPAPVPDEENFAMAPVVASTYGQLLDRNGHQIRPRNTNIVNRLEMPIEVNAKELTPPMGSWQKAVKTDLQAWQEYYRKAAALTNQFPVAPEPQSPAADVLLALSKYDPTIEELRQAGRRPYSRFPLEYDADCPAAILLPHLAMFKSCAKVLQLRASAELQLGQTEKALDDVNLSLRVAEAIRTEPIFISQLVRAAVVNVALQPVREGLADHKWSDEQLRTLDQELGNLDFLTDYRTAIRGEMASAAGDVDYLRRTRELGWAIGGPDGGVSRLIPSGWFYQNQLHCCRFENQWYLPLADQKRRLVSPAAVRRTDEALVSETSRNTPYNFLEKVLLPGVANAVKKFANAQANVDLARVACALDRYHLAHGQYPDALDALVPRFIETIPRDIIGGQPLHYRRTDGGQFLLYSVGWNETDDGGQVALKKDGAIDTGQGDWVWRYPGK